MELQAPCSVCSPLHRKPAILRQFSRPLHLSGRTSSARLRRQVTSQLKAVELSGGNGGVSYAPVPSHKVIVHDRERGVTHEFFVPEDQYILHTAEDQDIRLPFACRHGCCTSCAVRIKSGDIRQPEALGISAELKSKGYALLCVGFPPGNGPQNPAGGNPPPKPWERAGSSSSGPAPFKPPSAGNTSDVVEASGTANPGEIVSTSDRNVGVNTNALGRPLPSRPWENNTGSNSYGGYGTGLTNTSSYGSGMYNSTYGQGGLYGSGGGMYGGGMYGNSMYRGGGGGYGGGGLYGSGALGGGMYGSSGLGGGMGGYGMGGMGMGMGMGMGGPYGPQDPNNPYGEPPSPPGFWISFLRVMQGVVNFFGRISILIDQNTQAVHLFMSALLQLFDRGGLLYGELARFAMRLLGVKTKPRKLQPPQGPNGLPGPQMQALEAPKAAPAGGWDNVWGNDVNR